MQDSCSLDGFLIFQSMLGKQRLVLKILEDQPFQKYKPVHLTLTKIQRL